MSIAASDSSTSNSANLNTDIKTANKSKKNEDEICDDWEQLDQIVAYLALFYLIYYLFLLKNI
jgi:hypothetical protein